MTNPTGWIWALCGAWFLIPILLTLITNAIYVGLAKRRPRLEVSTWHDAETNRVHRVWMWDIQERSNTSPKMEAEE